MGWPVLLVTEHDCQGPSEEIDVRFTQEKKAPLWVELRWRQSISKLFIVAVRTRSLDMADILKCFLQDIVPIRHLFCSHKLWPFGHNRIGHDSPSRESATKSRLRGMSNSIKNGIYVIGTEVLFGTKRGRAVDAFNLVTTVFTKVRVSGAFGVFSVYNIEPDRII